MRFRITILCDNSVGSLGGTLGEHGFAVLVEPSQGQPLLFDTGQGLTLLHNARRMNRDLARITTVLLSHGHYDHTGGLLPLLRESGPKEVHAHSGIFSPRYRVREGTALKIGIPHSRELLEEAGASFHLDNGFREIAPSIFATGHVPRVTSFETGDVGLFLDPLGREPDRVDDDQSLLLATDSGPVLLLGCCHAGLGNTLAHIRSLTGWNEIHAVIGGTHLGFCGERQLEQTLQALRQAGVKKIAASHCTGFPASSRLQHEFPGRFHPAGVGYTIEC